MPQNPHERTVAYYPQVAGDLTTLPSTWDSDGDVVEFLCLEPSVEGLAETAVQNGNIRRRANAPHVHLPGLRSGSGPSLKMYASGSGVTTAADSAAASFALAFMLKNALCGQHLGYASAVVTPSTTAPDITVGQGTNHPAGAFILGYNNTAAAGELLCVDSVSTDVLTLRTTASAAVDVVHSVMALYPDTRALANRDHANHLSCALYMRGEDTEDNYEPYGVRFNVTGMESTEPGGDARFVFEGFHVGFNSESITRRDLTGTPQGPAGPVVGRSGTEVRIADHGTAAMTVLNCHSFTPTFGIASGLIPGMGDEGVLGYSYTAGDTMLELVVDYDDEWIVDYEAQTLKHVMVQVGDQPGDNWGIYFPRCQISVDPGRSNTSEQTTMTLVLKALEYEGTTHTEGTANYELERAAFVILLGA